MNQELLQLVVTELAEKLTGARIAKIHQPAAEFFVFRLWTGQENLKLLIFAGSGESRIHLTENTFPNPLTPPRFCQLLRARLSRILAIRQVSGDRIVELDCQGPKGPCRLIVELTGKSSNLILVAEDGRIIDSLRRQAGQKRPLVAGEIYSYPAKGSQADRSFDLAEYPAAETASEIAEKIYTSGRHADNANDLKDRIGKAIARELKKLQRRIRNIERELEQQQDFERYRQQGELLLANLHLLKKGMTEVSLVNYYRQPLAEETIELNSSLSPQENAEKYFLKYKKARRGQEHSARRQAETTAEIEWLEQLSYQLQEVQEPATIGLVADELQRAGVLREKAAKLPKITANHKNDYHQAVSPNGFKVLWGLNSRQNDALSTRLLKKTDLWFHAHRCPGSHVVLKAENGGKAFAEEDLLFAGRLAAAHSKAKRDHKVEVMVAEAKDIKKPSGAKPGMVTVQRYKTLVVKPLADENGVF